jgi:hypothetical protein
VRWSDYAGRPVVVVAGDAAQVAAGVRRLAPLTSNGTSPAVIGLVWHPTGPRGSPPPVKELEREAGGLPVPVGNAVAYPELALYFLDMGEIQGTEAGVIAFVDQTGTLIDTSRSDAPTGELRAGIDQLQ